ncbi:MAG: hypothetical protein ACREP8_11730 [Candidatus Binatia bacterium]
MDMEETPTPKPDLTQSRPSRLPLILTVVSLFIWFGFQTIELAFERNSLVSLMGDLQEGMQESQQVRSQLETLITKTAELARQGNANARKAVEELQQRGIPIPSEAPPAK